LSSAFELGWSSARVAEALGKLEDVGLITPVSAASKPFLPTERARFGHVVHGGLLRFLHYQAGAGRYRVAAASVYAEGCHALAPGYGVAKRYPERLARLDKDAQTLFHLIAVRWLAAHAGSLVFVETIAGFEKSGVRAETRSVEVKEFGFTRFQKAADQIVAVLDVSDDAGEAEIVGVEFVSVPPVDDWDVGRCVSAMTSAGIPVSWCLPTIEDLTGQGLFLRQGIRVERSARGIAVEETLRRVLPAVVDGSLVVEIETVLSAVADGLDVDEARERIRRRLREIGATNVS
jgi:DNA topoisomerase IA